MEVKPRPLRRYVKDDGRVPFGEWMDGLRDVRVRAIIAKRLTRVALGNFGDHKAVGGRRDGAANRYRSGVPHLFC